MENSSRLPWPNNPRTASVNGARGPLKISMNTVSKLAADSSQSASTTAFARTLHMPGGYSASSEVLKASTRPCTLTTGFHER
eukprot:10468926-Heterocapsa_arctica.AAC.1